MLRVGFAFVNTLATCNMLDLEAVPALQGTQVTPVAYAILCVRFVYFVRLSRSFLAARALRRKRNTRYGWVVNPFPTGTSTRQDTPSFLGAITMGMSRAPRHFEQTLRLHRVGSMPFSRLQLIRAGIAMPHDPNSRAALESAPIRFERTRIPAACTIVRSERDREIPPQTYRRRSTPKLPNPCRP